MSKSRELLTYVCERDPAKVAKLLWCDANSARAQGMEGNRDAQQAIVANNKDDTTSRTGGDASSISTTIRSCDLPNMYVRAEEAVSLSKLGDKKRSALHFAVENGDASIVVMILFTSRRPVTDADAALNALDDLGYAPLHRAAMAGRPDLLRLLLRAGADVNLRARVIRRGGPIGNSSSGSTSSKVAEGSSHYSSEQPPLEGQQQSYYSIQTPTVLEIAQREGVFRREECLLVLLSAGADVCPFQSSLWVQ